MNLVEDYLIKNKELKLSTRTLSKRLNIKVKKVHYLCFNSKLIKQVDPLEVGYLGKKINVFTSN